MASAASSTPVPAAAPRAAAGPDAVPSPGRSTESGPASLSDRGIARHDAIRAVRWTAAGTVKVTHEVEVEWADLRGTVSIGGTLHASHLASRGSLEVEGATGIAEGLSLRGDARFGSTVRAAEVDVDGTLRIEAELGVDRTLAGRGTLHAAQVSAGAFRFEGSVRVPGTVHGGPVDLHLTGDSRLGTVEAPAIRIRGQRPNLLDKVFFHEDRGHVTRIEGERVELEGVDVEFVRGREVVLGRACHVTEVEGTIRARHPSSSVGPRSKSPPPYGLRR